MRELIISRSNHLIDPHMHVWAWQIPLYLFLGGLVAGLMIVTGLALLRGHAGKARSIVEHAPWISLAALTLGMLFLFLDLEHKPYVWRLYTTFQPASPMSWGSWILLLVYPALIAATLVRPPDIALQVPYVEELAQQVSTRASAVRAIAWANVAIGVALGIYTGILLGALGRAAVLEQRDPRAAVPAVGAVVRGGVGAHDGAGPRGARAARVARQPLHHRGTPRADAFVLGLASGSAASREAAALVLGGPFTAVFWVGVVGLGLVVPLIIQSLAVTHRVMHTAVAPVLVLLGGLALRFVFVYAGQASHWAARLAAAVGLA